MSVFLGFILVFIITGYIIFRTINYCKVKELLNVKIFSGKNYIIDKTIIMCDDNKTISSDVRKVVEVKNKEAEKLVNGMILFEKYEIIKQIGSGSMGKVYIVKNIKLGNIWALKVVNYYDNAGLFREEGILRKINYISIPKIVDVYYEDDNVYIIEDYIEGISLDKLIAINGNFSQKQIIDWAIELCEILEYLHEMEPYPIIYRDLKPSNIIVTNYNKLVIIDFGISKYKLDNKMDFVPSGTRKYAPIEQFSDARITDEKTDIYSLGIILCECILGYIPISDDDIKKMLKFVDLELVLIIIKAINPNRNDRYGCAVNIKKDLANLKNLSLIKYKRKIIFKIMTIMVFVAILLLVWEMIM